MSVRFDASGDDYFRDFSLGAQANFTLAGWAKITNDRNSFSVLFDVDNGADRFFCQTGADGTTLQVADEGASQVGPALTVGTWYYIAAAASGSSGTLYVRSNTATSWTTQAWSGFSASTDIRFLVIGVNGAGEWWDGCVESVKFWTATLTQAELELEYRQQLPTRTASLRGWWPLIKPETVDYSGNGAALTAEGILTQEDGPGIAWRQGSVVAPVADAAAVDASVPYAPPRYPQYRDPGETWWIQGDRRNANLVGSAANPLVSPLDSAWQADARYWHLYSDVPLRTSQAYYTQKDRRSANLVAAADPLVSPLDSAWQVGGRYWHLRNDWSEPPARPQQRPYISDPTLLVTVDFDPLTVAAGGGGDTWRRYNLPSYADRREVPQQRIYFADIDATPLDPTTAAWAYLWQVYNTAAIHVDRREVPQQRPYISDPSFYPTVPPTDPLTLAWGAGGHYWLIYHTAALLVDRRELPQQRQYESVPGLLLTALLENELLGGATTALRANVPATHYDRRQTGGYQPRWPELVASLPADPLLVGAGVGGDRWRRYATPSTHVNRRLAPQQRPYARDVTLDVIVLVYNATSTVAVVAGRTSTAAAAAGRTSTSGVTGRATSTPSVSDG